MKALLLTEYQCLEVTDFPDPNPGPDDVLVEIRACGICGSDIHGYDGSSGRRIPPLIMGHEAAGVVAATGQNVDRFSVGDRITFDSTVSCGECHFCRKGKINLCDRRRVLGVSCEDYRQHGAFAEQLVVPQHICYRLPDQLALEHAALIEAVSIAVHAAARTPIELGDVAVVVGAGMIGLLTIQAIRLAGCSTVVAVDLDDRRLQIARRLGAEHALRADQLDVPAAVREITEGRGADIAMEVVGASEPLQTAIASTRKGGSVTLIGNLSPTVDFAMQQVVTRELSLLGSCASNGEYPVCIDLLTRGDIDVTPLITATAPLEEGPAWFERLYAGEPNAMKVILQPT